MDEISEDHTGKPKTDSPYIKKWPRILSQLYEYNAINEFHEI